MSEDARWQFPLPEELIAQQPPARRGDSRLLLVEPHGAVVGEEVFRKLPTILRSGDLLVLNDSRVLPARLRVTRSDTGGQVEILLIRPTARNTWLAMARPARRLREGIELMLGSETLTVVQKRPDGQVLIRGERNPADLAHSSGEMPLPPYIQRAAGPEADQEQRRQDAVRYQTVFNRPDPSGAGSVAAPTAGLHFSDATLEALQDQGIGLARVQLHVGPGTFKPPTPEQIASGRLHREFFRFDAACAAAVAETRRQGGRVIAVGTTSLRVLETVARLNLPAGAGDTATFGPTLEDADPFFTGHAHRKDGHWSVEGMTRLFIQPPDRVQAADGLLTNFHLPGSSLLMLVAALAGQETWRAAYAHAIENRLRFYSYGDCMLILPGLAGSRG